MTSLLTLLYILFTMFNSIVFIKIYWPVFVHYFSAARFVKKVIGSWWLFFITCTTIQILYLKQKWFKTVEDMGNDRYKLNIVIRGRMVNLLIEPIKKRPVAIFDQDVDKCLTDEFISFFQYTLTHFSPTDYGYDSIYLYFQNGNMSEYKNKSVTTPLENVEHYPLTQQETCNNF